MDITFPGICEGLASLNFDYGVPDLDFPESFDDFRLIFVPIGEFMAAQSQRFLIELAKKGKTLVLVGVLPKLDQNMRSCTLLSEELGLRTRPGARPGSVEAHGESFAALVFSEITPRKARGAKAIAKERQHLLGAGKKVGSGEIYLFTFDIAPSLNPQKTIFFARLLGEQKITSPVSCSDPSLQVVVQEGPKMVVIYLFDPQKRDRGSGGASRKTIITLDCRRLGIVAKRVRLVDIFGEGKIITNPRELSSGLLLEIEEGDSRLYLVNKR